MNFVGKQPAVLIHAHNFALSRASIPSIFAVQERLNFRQFAVNTWSNSKWAGGPAKYIVSSTERVFEKYGAGILKLMEEELEAEAARQNVPVQKLFDLPAAESSALVPVAVSNTTPPKAVEYEFVQEILTDQYVFAENDLPTSTAYLYEGELRPSLTEAARQKLTRTFEWLQQWVQKIWSSLSTVSFVQRAQQASQDVTSYIANAGRAIIESHVEKLSVLAICTIVCFYFYSSQLLPLNFAQYLLERCAAFAGLDTK